jgi:large subunit ribosomal protein L15
MPLVRRVPKRGFTNIFRTEYNVVNLDKLEALGLEEITLADYYTKKLVRNKTLKIKILGDGEITKKIKVHAHKFSKSALEKIQKVGGEAIIL